MPNVAKFEMVSVDHIALDTTNPRIAHALSSYTPPFTAEQVFLALNFGGSEDESGSGTTFHKLKQSILTNGGISQPVHLHQVGPSSYVSIEGNTRVALYQDFKRQAIPGAWDQIPSFVYADVRPEELHAIRLQAHLVGPRAWDPYSKAKYLHQLRTQQHYPFQMLVDLCGGNKRSIQESLEAYEDMEHYYRPLLQPGERFDTSRFSGFVELQKPGVKQAITEAGYSTADFAQWLRSGKIDRLADVRWLTRVLRHPRARAIFVAEDMEAAKRAVEAPALTDALERAGLPALARALTQSIQKLEFAELNRLRRDPSSPAVQDLTEVHESLSSLLEELGIELE